MSEFPIRTVDHSATSLQIVEDREISDSDSDFENGGYLDSLGRDELYLATRLASALYIRDILAEPSPEIGLAIVQTRLTRDHGPMPSYEEMQNPTTDNLWGIIHAVAADIIFGMEMHPVPPLTDEEEVAWRKVVKRIRGNYTEDPIFVQPPPPAAEDVQPPAAEEIQPPAAEEIQPPAAEEIQPPAAEDQPPTPGPEGSPPEDPPAEASPPAPRRTLRARLSRAWRRVRGFLTCSATRTA
ncbi:fibrous sheath CABYR-binding protein-like [Hyperolius riggenbachi]|uniref:fibrous sheath CABYR-binding protein-like n=1 Tax=Hyperolius riggenbachi TaxID=752182 RepID=UPI0035A35C79